MNRTVLLIIGSGMVAYAQTAESATKSMDPGMMMVCHSPKSGEKANASMENGKMPMVCKTVSMKKVMAGPDMPAKKDAADAFAAWQGFISDQLGMH